MDNVLEAVKETLANTQAADATIPEIQTVEEQVDNANNLPDQAVSLVPEEHEDLAILSSSDPFGDVFDPLFPPNDSFGEVLDPPFPSSNTFAEVFNELSLFIDNLIDLLSGTISSLLDSFDPANPVLLPILVKGLLINLSSTPEFAVAIDALQELFATPQYLAAESLIQPPVQDSTVEKRMIVTPLWHANTGIPKRSWRVGAISVLMITGLSLIILSCLTVVGLGIWAVLSSRRKAKGKAEGKAEEKAATESHDEVVV